jgi:hypothetical protein
METAFIYKDQYDVLMRPESFPEGYILYDCPSGADDYEIVHDTGVWWFTAIKYDGTLWKTRLFDLDELFR